MSVIFQVLWLTAGVATVAAMAASSATVIIMINETVCCCIGSNSFLVALAGA